VVLGATQTFDILLWEIKQALKEEESSTLAALEFCVRFATFGTCLSLVLIKAKG
jgi:hypothetical protein